MLAAQGRFVEDPVAEEVTLYLKPQLNDDSLVVVSQCSDARYWYYFLAHGIPDRIILVNNRYFDKVFIIVYTQDNFNCRAEIMANIFTRYGPNLQFFDINTARVINQINYATLYEIDPILSRIEKAYPNH
jgi:hypothetical protein